MRTHWTVAIMASLGFTGFVLAADPTPGAAPTTRPITGGLRTDQAFALPAGFAVKDLADTKDIKNSLAEIVDDAVTRNGFDNLVGRLADNDRDRIGEFKDRKVDNLNQIVDRIQQQWKQKYNQDFNTERNRDTVFTDAFRIIQGEVSDPAVAMANWPVQATTPGRGEAVPAAGREPGAAAPVPGEKVTDRGPIMEKLATPFTETAVERTQLEKGRKVALVDFPESHGQPGLRLSFLRELPDRWKLDIPNNITGQQLHDSLIKHLTWVADHPDQWTADAADGYRMLSHHVLMALYSIDSGAGQMDRMNDGRMDRTTPARPGDRQNAPPAPMDNR